MAAPVTRWRCECGETLEYPAKKAGQSYRCPSCGQHGWVPKPAPPRKRSAGGSSFSRPLMWAVSGVALAAVVGVASYLIAASLMNKTHAAPKAEIQTPVRIESKAAPKPDPETAKTNEFRETFDRLQDLVFDAARTDQNKPLPQVHFKFVRDLAMIYPETQALYEIAMQDGKLTFGETRSIFRAYIERRDAKK